MLGLLTAANMISSSRGILLSIIVMDTAVKAGTFNTLFICALLWSGIKLFVQTLGPTGRARQQKACGA